MTEQNGNEILFGMYFHTHCLSLFYNGNNKLTNEIFYYMYSFVLYIDKSIFIAGCVVLAFIVTSIIIGLVYFGWIRNTTPCINVENCFVKMLQVCDIRKNSYIFVIYKNKAKIIYLLNNYIILTKQHLNVKRNFKKNSIFIVCEIFAYISFINLDAVVLRTEDVKQTTLTTEERK